MADSITLFGVNPAGPFLRDDVLAGVTFSLGSGAGTPVNTGTIVNRGDPRISYLGGHVSDFWNGYPGNQFTTTFSITDSNKQRAMGGRIAFRTDAASFDIRMMMQGYPTQFSLLIDGERVDAALPAIPADGSLRWLTIDLSQTSKASGWKTVEFEFRGGANLGGIALSPGSAIESSLPAGPRVVFLGDSITEGGGSNSAAEDWVSIAARSLGIQDAWQSGTGGTGYARPLNERYALVDRIVADGVDADAEIVVIAMGINDVTDIFDEASAVFQALIDPNPDIRIIALTSWNPVAPGPTVKPLSDANIRAAAALFPQVTVIDASDLSYRKGDPVHPDADGHWTIGEWLAPRIARSFQADGLIDKDVAGDVIGPLFLENHDPASLYTFEVLEGGLPSTRFEVIDSGDPFPLLRLMDGHAVPLPGPLTVTVKATGSGGHVLEGAVTFAVRQHLQGDAGDNALTGTGAGLRLSGHGGNDTMTGTAGADLLLGGSGNDVLNALGGADEMAGEAGDDTYTVDHAGDLVLEAPNGGTDTVISLFEGYSLPVNVEALTLSGTVLEGGGNDSDNVLRGNALDNRIVGNDGADTIYGRGGADRLYGDAGNDFIIGGAGIDSMYGGSGDDQFMVEDIGDLVVEAASQGNDLVISLIPTYTLPTNVERLRLTGMALDGMGNAAKNTLNGNELGNLLSGLGGNDTLRGAGGNDVLDGGRGFDTLDGGDGIDTARFAGPLSAFSVNIGKSSASVTEIATGEADSLYGIEKLDFAGTLYTIDFTSRLLVLG